MAKVALVFAAMAAVGALTAGGDESWRYDRRPRRFGNAIASHELDPSDGKVMKKIALYHNFFRSKVEPKAANMLLVKWHRGAAKTAQKWSDRCQLLKHDPPQERYDVDYGNCGQNIFISSHRVPWYFAIKSWFLERDNFTYGSAGNDLKVVGHYTQMVWATSHRVGCGLTECPSGGPGGKPFFNYICNYCPTGNWEQKLSTPYKKGKPCGRCPKQCRRDKLCTNGCEYADKWSNCKELAAYGKRWLCSTASDGGDQRLDSCRATCLCANKIHEWR